MMRRVRTSKWESSIYSGLTTLALMILLYYGWVSLADNAPSLKSWMSWTSVLVLGQMAISYRFAQRTQRKLDQLQVVMKQASAGNWDSRLPEIEGDAFSGVNREFNVMLGQLESRLKLLQQLGERDVMEEVSSQEAAVLEERKRLARDLHDTVSQQLFALHMSASSLPKLLERDSEHAQKVMEQLIAMSSSAQRQMRGLIAQLRPMELQGRTLEEALERWFPDYCRQNGIQGTLEIQIKGLISDAKEHQLFLIIQEAMANVVKHADAQSVRLFLGETDRQISLLIEDNGLGFRGEQVRAGAYGLSTMRERAQKLGGEAEIVTKPGSGTRVRVWFPKFEEMKA
ncbi:HAMP domain-containing sensor histidine kinase [Cohnella silvisoli]|uniref:histidine kinase n=1 Tax=Cohnella silvisoli TaxID=2873699 RepID=A0ABV1L6J1_9BACL|nr:HAMP domain-containing sensor histidine kinase [Cohnella silvisoli]MCD9026496.1 HAMP domain-containing sensor histidine kinase [Cohnella silvisoli]